MNTIIETEKIGKNFRIGDFSIIRKNVTIGDNVEITEFCVIGCVPWAFDEKSLDEIPIRLEPRGSIVIGNNVFINSHTDVATGLDKTTFVEDNVVMGQNVIVGHDVHVHKNVRLMNCVILGGYSIVGEGTFIGMDTHVRNRINIGKNCKIGMGSNVVKDIPDNVIAYGNPCKVQCSNTYPTIVMRKIKKEVKKVF
jgi:UDP-3-O-[3-hydroxymyristoyl] glucosamine N-acyltransferase